MSITGKLYGGPDNERFVVTRSQLMDLEKRSYMSGANSGFRVDRFLYERKVTTADDCGAEQVTRAKWLHIVTARHLRKARRTIRELREEVGRLQRVCDEKNAVIFGYRGQIGRDNPFAHVPDHYLGDGFVTCDRAIESASSQDCIAERSPLQFWYWATAMKYVWRMWSKEDHEKDALKAIDCLEKAAGLGRRLGRLITAEEREDG